MWVLRLSPGPSGEGRVDAAFVAALDRALDRVLAVPPPAALVTVGGERYFSTGLDLAGLGALPRDRAWAVVCDFERLLARLLELPMATVAALSGHAFAAGALLALAHDFRVMRADRGWFCMPEVDLATGLPLTPGMRALLAARLEPGAAHEALLTGRRYDARAARGRGLVDEVLPADALLPGAIARAASLAERDRRALGRTKRALFADAIAALAPPAAAGPAPGDR